MIEIKIAAARVIQRYKWKVSDKTQVRFLPGSESKLNSQNYKEQVHMISEYDTPPGGGGGSTHIYV